MVGALAASDDLEAGAFSKPGKREHVLMFACIARVTSVAASPDSDMGS
jgi:hypothetical protein